MKGIQGFTIAAASLWIAASLQKGLVPHLAFGGVAPDFLLIVVATLGLFSDVRSGAMLGFFAGLMQGSLCGANLAIYIVSRTICGYLLGWFNSLELVSNPLVAVIAAAAVTVGSQLFVMFWAPPSGISAFLASTAGSAIINGLIGAPVYILMRQILGTRRL